MKKSFILSIIVLTSLFVKSQPLFTFGSQPVSKEEFLRVYNKNNSKNTSYSEKAIKEYLELYINFKLKVKAAEDLGMDTVPAFKDELAGYRKQLAQPYLSDKSVTEKLINEAYERMQTEINASHILVTCALEALPKDTQIAYNKIIELRNRILKGESFDSVAYYSSEDPSAKRNMGNLGFFTAFQMIYPFESAAYNTSIGTVSMPVRTQFGYHLIKVIEKRKARGEVKVAHIMINIGDPNNTRVSDEKDTTNPRNKAYAIYEKLKAGGNWEDLCAQYSEDYYSAKNGGLLNWVSSSSRYPNELKEAAFALDKDGDYSKPVKTDFGWHIVKRLEKKEVPGFAEIKESIAQKVQKDSRSELNNDAVVDRIKRENNFNENQKNLKLFVATVDSTLLKAGWIPDSTKSETQKATNLVSLGGESFSAWDFSKYLFEYQTPRNGAALEGVVNAMYKEWVKQTCLNYEERNLDKKNEDFKNLMKEYRDGILLFDLTDKKVWSKAVSDTSGLKEFYETIKTKYMWKERADAAIYECADAKIAKKAMKMAKKGVIPDSIISSLNKSNPLNITIKQGKYERGENKWVDSVQWVVGIAKISKTKFIQIREVLPPQPKALNEARGLITSDYQAYLEKRWLEELRTKYPVVVNNEVLNSIIVK